MNVWVIQWSDRTIDLVAVAGSHDTAVRVAQRIGRADVRRLRAEDPTSFPPGPITFDVHRDGRVTIVDVIDGVHSTDDAGSWFGRLTCTRMRLRTR